MGFIKKFILSCLIFILLTFSFVPPARAQGTWYNQSFEEWATKVFDEGSSQEIFGERYTFAQVQWIVYSFASLLAGTDLLRCAGLATQDNVDQFKSCVNNLNPVSADSSGNFGTSLVGLAVLADYLSTVRPASGVLYMSELATRYNIIPEASAQEGLGFRSLTPIINIWRATRNIAYLLSVVVILIMAFMIMFRVKISPQTVISIQSALPKLVVTLILITFSYAIAGFIVDTSYLIIGLIALLAKSQGLAGNLTPPISAVVIAQRMWSNAFPALGSIVALISIPLIIILGLGGLAVGSLLGTVTLPVVGTVGGAGLGGIVGVVLFLVAFGVILWTFIRLLWTMLRSLVNIVLLVIFGPFLLLAGGISSNVGGFGVWLRNLAANVAVFPVISIMAFIAHLIYWSTNSFFTILREGSWVNPFEIGPSIENASISIPLFGMSPIVFSIIVPLGILFLMPSAADLIKSILQGQPFNYGTAIGQAAAPVRMAWGMTGAPVWDAYRRFGSEQSLAGVLGALSRLPGRTGDYFGNIAEQYKQRRER